MPPIAHARYDTNRFGALRSCGRALGGAKTSGEGGLDPAGGVVEVADGVAGVDELVARGAGVVVEREIEDPECVVELRHRARADDRRRDPGLVLHPEQRELRRRDAALAREFTELAPDLEAGLGHPSPRALDPGGA